jgi:predicted phosphodiesterase
VAYVQTDTKVLALPDIHAPLHSERCLRLVRSFKKDFAPTRTIVLGDCIDAAAISTFAKDVGATDTLHEFEVCNDILDSLDLKPNDVYMEGNHELRFRRPGCVPQDLRRILEPQRWLRIKERKLKWVPYNTTNKGLYRIGRLSFIHGFATGVNAGRKEAGRYGHVVHGHTHRVDVQSAESLGEPSLAFNIGCLCDIPKMDYAFSRGMPPWVNGFGFGTVKKSGHFTFNVVRILGSSVLINEKEYKL